MAKSKDKSKDKSKGKSRPEHADPIDRSLSVHLVEHDPRTMFFREVWASGEIGGLEFDLTRNISGDSVILKMGERLFSMLMRDFIQAVYEQHGKPAEVTSRNNDFLFFNFHQ